MFYTPAHIKTQKERTEMKKNYVKPEVELMLVEAESILAGTNGQNYDPNQSAEPVPIVPGPWG